MAINKVFITLSCGKLIPHSTAFVNSDSSKFIVSGIRVQVAAGERTPYSVMILTYEMKKIVIRF